MGAEPILSRETVNNIGLNDCIITEVKDAIDILFLLYPPSHNGHV